MKLLNNILLFLFFILIFTSCEIKEGENKEVKTTPEISEKVLVKVGGETITDIDYDIVVTKLFGENAKKKISEEDKQKILESLVVSKAISMKMEKKLKDKEKALIEKKLQNFKEELLVQEYLYRYARPELVSSAMVEKYYNDNPEKFKAKSFKKYELIKTGEKIPGSKRSDLLNTVGNIKSKSDFILIKKLLKARGFNVSHFKGRSDKALLDDRLFNLIEKTKVNEVAEPLFIDGVFHLVKVYDKVDSKPEPIGKVRNQIRNILAPIQVKKALKKAADEILKNTEVEYIKPKS